MSGWDRFWRAVAAIVVIVDVLLARRRRLRYVTLSLRATTPRR